MIYYIPLLTNGLVIELEPFRISSPQADIMPIVESSRMNYHTIQMIYFTIYLYLLGVLHQRVVLSINT